MIPTLILLLASVMPLAVVAQGPAIDGPTQTALNALRTNAAAMVGSLENNNGVSGGQLTASYTDQLVLSNEQMNDAMIVQTRAEQAAWLQMDPPRGQ